MEIIKASPGRADRESVSECAAYIRRGLTAAFPTETVYGLGGDAADSGAVRSVFQVKKRSPKSPLVVHSPSLDRARLYASFSPCAERLARAFWPGPLTLVLPRLPGCPLAEEVYGSRPTIGIRVPDHPFALALLEALDHPLVVPSANVSGQLSPTRAEHVLAAFQGASDKPDFLVDMGSCALGLESTIVGFSAEDDTPLLIRHGAVTAEELEAFLGEPVSDTTRRPSCGCPSDSGSTPVQQPSCRAPVSPLHLNCDPCHYKAGQNWLCFGPLAPQGDLEGCLNLSQKGSLKEASANLYGMLYDLDKRASGEPIFVVPIPSQGLGLGINDRLGRLMEIRYEWFRCA